MTRAEIDARVDLIVGKSTTTRYVSRRQGKPGKRKKGKR
jgi:hypothetical protein